MNLFNLFSLLLKYIFILIIYLFIFSIIKMIYQDISRMKIPVQPVLPTKFPYLLLMNNREKLYFDAKEFYPLDKIEITLGRSKKCDIRLDDISLSSKHIKLWHDGDEWHILDLQSKNGTILNDERIDGEYLLDDGDIIQIGQLEFQFCINK